MPRTRPAAPKKTPPPPATAIVASAANVSRGDYLPKSADQKDWQRAGWVFYDTIGEFRFSANWLGNALSRVNLDVFRDTDAGPELVEDGPARDALDALFDGETGQSQMMSALGIHLTVPGEAYVVGEPNEKPGRPDTWSVLSTDEITTTSGGHGGDTSNLDASIWQVDRGDGRKKKLDPKALVIRIWRPHPRKYIEADSPTRAVLPILREIEQLTKHVAAAIDSRLAGAGILLLPNEMTFSAPNADPDTVPSLDPFTDALTEAMLTPIEDRSSAAAVVPIVVRAPAGVLASAQHMTFSTPFDEQAQSLREEGIRRLALGMDMPPEILLGQGDSNHWSAWAVDEAALKIHVEPACELVCDALTKQYLWPILATTAPDVFVSGDYYIGYDTSDLRLRPNRSGEAIQLYDRLELTGEALRRETGFDESDRPNDEELQSVLLKQLARVSGENQTAAAAQLGVPLGAGPDGLPLPGAAGRPSIEQQFPGAVEQPDAGAGVRALPDNPGGAVPAPTAVAASAANVACELLALRGLERANNRITKRGSGPRKVCTAAQADAALADAWENVAILASAIGFDADDLTRRLDSYARTILYTGGEHSPELLHKIVWETPAHVIAAAYAHS